MFRLAVAFAAFATIAAASGRLPVSAFEYDRSRPLDIVENGVQNVGRAVIRDITFANTEGGRTAAYVVAPSNGAKGPGILFVHWYEPESTTSNRRQFLQQAPELASRLQATSLLIETMWSEPKWFATRNRDDDFASSVRQVRELRRALDALTVQPSVDASRIGYVGHDFGAMYGAVLAGVDDRVSAWALHAGTASFSDWFLLGAKLSSEERRRVINRLAPLDPVLYIAEASPSPVLLQFGAKDRYVPEDQAKALFDAAREPKSILWYDAGHALNDQAIRDRQEWLCRQLEPKPSQRK
jgi:dienelactone hydrolase